MINRRGLLIGSGGLALTGLTGCGQVSSDSAGGGTPKRGGLLRVGTMEPTQAGNLDAHKPVGSGTIRGWALYAKLWEWTTECTVKLALAEFSEVAAGGLSLVIRLKKGLEFHHGKTIGADDVLHSIHRLSDPALASPYAALVGPVDRDRLEKLDDLTVRIHAKDGQGLVALPETWISFGGIVPTDYHPVSNPVGAGPFKLKSFVPGQRSTYTRFENYFKPGQPYLDELEIIEFADQTARAYALQSGQIDLADLVPPEQARLLRASSSVSVVLSPTNNVQSFDMNVEDPVFQDVRVRQAFRFAADRDDLVLRALHGEGVTGNDLYGPDDPTFDRSIQQRPYDPDRAKSLLRAAGAEGLKIELTAQSAGTGAALVFAEQLKKIGVELNVRQVDSANFNGPLKNRRSISVGGIPSRGFLPSALHYDAPTATSNRTNFSDPRFGELINAALREPDIAKRTPLVHQAQAIQYERGGLLIWGFNHVRAAASNTIGGLGAEKTQFAGWRFDQFWQQS